MSMMNMLLGAGGFNPLSLSPALWLDASDSATLFQDTAGTTPATANDDPVGRWNDKSGNGLNVTQATVSRRPLLKTSVQNGRNAVLGDGVDDFLSNTAFSAEVACTSTTIMVVSRSPSATASDKRFWEFRRSTSGNPIIANMQVANAERMRGRNDATLGGPSDTIPTESINTGWSIREYHWDGSTLTHLRDGVTIGTVAFTGTVTVNQLGLMCSDVNSGGSNFTNAFLAEFIWSGSTSLSVANRNAQRDYLKSKWSTP